VLGALLRPKVSEAGEVRRNWAARSGGRCVFATLFKRDVGLNVMQQIGAATARA
jgi:hypothetical protein